MHNFKNDPSNLPQIVELIKLIVIELITAFNNPNLKTRKLAEESFLSLCDLLKHFNYIPQLF